MPHTKGTQLIIHFQSTWEWPLNSRPPFNTLLHIKGMCSQCYHLKLLLQSCFSSYSWYKDAVDIAVQLTGGHFSLLSQNGFQQGIMDEDVLLLKGTTGVRGQTTQSLRLPSLCPYEVPSREARQACRLLSPLGFPTVGGEKASSAACHPQEVPWGTSGPPLSGMSRASHRYTALNVTFLSTCAVAKESKY